MDTIRVCTNCGRPMPADAPAGLCPACLLRSQEVGSRSSPASAEADAALSRRPKAGELFGGYRIIRMLGQGGMGEVYEAEHVESARRVALKVMNQALASEEDRKRFLREGRLAASISHPNVVYIYGSEEISGSPVIAMELVASGTLHDKLKRGPVSSAEAVDATLQIMAGLEAAQTTGILHRDIKPANCFIGADGTVKVGDFGLSVSTIARGESLLTARGAVLGTPAYASPEQLRGEDLDVASDIYSVGATLYHLLTGRLPYEATDFIKLITEVLDKTPVSPEKLRPEIPAGLAKVVMRCLRKERAERFASYAALRDALLPFSSVAPSPAVLGLRFVAGLVDEIVAYTPAMLLLLVTARDPMERFFVERTWSLAALAMGFLLWDLLYYAIPEGLWGASVGKAVCGLRVVGPSRGSAGIGRALLRSLIFRTTWSVPVLITLFLYSGAEYSARTNEAHWNPEDWFWLPWLPLLFCTMRRRNGFAGIHELASGTRVIARPTAEHRPRLAVVESAGGAPAVSSLSRLGPYDVLGSLGSTGQGELLLAHDAALRRDVWIHRLPAGAPPVLARRRDLSRATRLRWLNGHRDSESAWDAYEAPDGCPLLKVPTQSWGIVRFWLYDLATEFASGVRHDSLAPTLALNHVWVTKENRAVMLDFPFPETGRQEGEGPSSEPSTSFKQLQRFLTSVLGRGVGHRQNPRPLHAQPFLHSLAEKRFESAEVLAGNLQSLLAKPAEVSRRRRAAVMGVALGPSMLLAVTVAITLWFSNRRVERNWPAEFPGSAELRAELLAYDAFNDSPAAEKVGLGVGGEGDDATKRFRRAFRIHFAAHHREVIANPAFWAHPAVAESLGSDLRRVAEEAIGDFPTVKPAELEEADATLRYLRTAIEAVNQSVPERTGFLTFWVLLVFMAALDLGAVLVMGEGLFLRLLGVDTVTRGGEKASRLRGLFRAFLAWSPVAVGAGLSLVMWIVWLPGIDTTSPAILTSLGVLGILSLAGLVYAVWKPSRGVVDRIAGTWLVPR